MIALELAMIITWTGPGKDGNHTTWYGFDKFPNDACPSLSAWLDKEMYEGVCLYVYMWLYISTRSRKRPDR